MGNLVTDLSPLFNMTTLTHLDLGYNRIVDISPLENLTRLTWLELSGNQIVDISPLSNLTQLTLLEAFANKITDVTPLTNLTRLEHLKIQGNLIFDHSPLDGLALTVFEYDQSCEMPPLPLQERLNNMRFPSLISQWGWPLVNKPHLSYTEHIAKHNLCFQCVGSHKHLVFDTRHGWQVRSDDLDASIQLRNDYLAHNPNMLFMIVISAVVEGLDTFDEDSPYWLRDEDGEIMRAWGGGLVDFNHPDVQNRTIERAVAISKCGLYDGVIFDGWSPWHNERRGTIPGMVAILKGIRERVSPDFLIAANTNEQIAPDFAPYMNGLFMESGLPVHYFLEGGEEELSRGFSNLKHTLSWAQEHMLKPQINAFFTLGINTPDNPMEGATNLQWMRAATTLNLTFSDGFFYYHIEGAPYDGSFYWFDFWDADLGRPIGEKSQLYDDTIPGLYIREFTKGWAVYNHSGAPQVITLPEEVQGVASNLVNTEHALPNLDGEIYLRAVLKNPADVNGDGVVNIFDLTLVAQAIGTNDRQADVNGDGMINVFDLVVIANAF